jgi:SAM-dependent methyltransferase
VVAPRLRGRGIGFVVSMDLSERMAALSGRPAVAGDEEWLPFGRDSFDLVVANLSLHWVNDLPGALVQIRRCLRPDGLFLASLPGLGTLAPLRDALATAEAELRGGVSPRVSPFPDLQDMAGLLQRAGFALPVADAEELPLAYRTPTALLGDLRDAGEANAVLARDGRAPPRALLPMALARLQAAGPDGIRPVLRLLTVTGWAPHESQSTPARPGSAGVRLADALGVEERSAGEKAGR